MGCIKLFPLFVLINHLLCSIQAKAVHRSDSNSPLDFISSLENRALEEYLKQGGLRSIEDVPDRIVGGINAAEGDAPFQAQIFRTSWWPMPPAFLCGGSLISPTTMLTAGHCVFSKNMSKYIVRYGSNSRFSSQYPDARVKEIKRHPEFDLDTVQNDLALFILESPVQPGANVRAVELQQTSVAENTTATLFGFGLTNGMSFAPSKILQKSQLQTISEKECAKYISELKITKSPGMLCTKAEGRSACNGDSGGPLVVSETGLQTGIVSFGTRFCPAGSINVFTNVPNYLDWINSNMEK